MKIEYKKPFIVVTRKNDGKKMVVSIEAIDSIEPIVFNDYVKGKLETEEWSRITLRRSKMYEVEETVSYFIEHL